MPASHFILGSFLLNQSTWRCQCFYYIVSNTVIQPVIFFSFITYCISSSLTCFASVLFTPVLCLTPKAVTPELWGFDFPLKFKRDTAGMEAVRKQVQEEATPYVFIRYKTCSLKIDHSWQNGFYRTFRPLRSSYCYDEDEYLLSISCRNN